jgi:Predicted 3'-5' exonuclease related to the exonuclease domain of PolB
MPLERPTSETRAEKDLISAFVNKIAELKPQLVTFNGSGFDLPVLRYRAMVNEVSAPGLSARQYFRSSQEGPSTRISPAISGAFRIIARSSVLTLNVRYGSEADIRAPIANFS